MATDENPPDMTGTEEQLKARADALMEEAMRVTPSKEVGVAWLRWGAVNAARHSKGSLRKVAAEWQPLADRAAAQINAHAARIATLEAALRAAYRPHQGYQSTRLCAYAVDGSPCNCGADEHNARIDAALRGEP